MPKANPNERTVNIASRWFTVATLALASLAGADVAAAAPSAQSSALSRVAQIALTVRDLPAAMKFYKDTLGLKLLFETNGMAFFDAGSVRLLVGVARSAQVVPGNTVVYFDAQDWQAAEQQLASRGVAFDSPIEVVQRTNGKELVLHQFKDPDGNLLAILGWRAAP